MMSRVVACLALVASQRLSWPVPVKAMSLMPRSEATAPLFRS
jgi:hypothetical protein